MVFTDFRHRLIDLNLSQAQLSREIEKRFGEKLTSAELARIIKGLQSGNKAERVKSEVEQILTEMEKGGS